MYLSFEFKHDVFQRLCTSHFRVELSYFCDVISQDVQLAIFHDANSQEAKIQHSGAEKQPSRAKKQHNRAVLNFECYNPGLSLSQECEAESSSL